jgi:hypothetical protein
MKRKKRKTSNLFSFSLEFSEVKIPMGRSLLIVSVISGAVSVVRLLSNLFVIYVTLGWTVWRAKRAFVKELVRAGIPKEDARRMGDRYAALKDETLNALKTQGFSFGSFFSQKRVDESSDEKRFQVLGVKL